MWNKLTEVVEKMNNPCFNLFHHIFPLSLTDVVYFKLRTFGYEFYGNLRAIYVGVTSDRKKKQFSVSIAETNIGVSPFL